MNQVEKALRDALVKQIRELMENIPDAERLYAVTYDGNIGLLIKLRDELLEKTKG